MFTSGTRSFSCILINMQIFFAMATQLKAPKGLSFFFSGSSLSLTLL